MYMKGVFLKDNAIVDRMGVDVCQCEERQWRKRRQSRQSCNEMIRGHLYNGDRKELFNFLMTTAHNVMIGSDVCLWDRELHRLGVCLFSEGIVLLCTEHQAETLKELFSNIIAHGKPRAENIHYIESLLVSLLGIPHRRGRVLDELFEWVRFGDRYAVESIIGGDMYDACSTKRLKKLTETSRVLTRGQPGDKYKLQTFINSLIPSSRTVSTACFNHMTHCAKIAKLCHSDPKIITQIHLALKFLVLHYETPNVVDRWCKQITENNIEEDLSTWLLDVNSRPDTPLIELTRVDSTECDLHLSKRARVL